jgi:predicted nucleic acid-binding protein
LILLDTNVLVYGVGRDHPLKPVAADLLSLVDTHPLRTTRDTVAEFAHAFARAGRARAYSLEIANSYFELLGPVVETTDEDVVTGLDLWVAYEALDVFDAVLAATALRFDALLVSADRAYADVSDLRFLDLADPDLFDRLQTRT